MNRMVVPHVILFDIDYTLFDTDEYKNTQLTSLKLFSEIEGMLEELHGEWILGILSEGEEEFQQNKLVQTSIVRYFRPEHTHIVVNKLEALPSILKKYENSSVTLVDDRLPILYNAKKLLPSLRCIWIKRGVYASAQEPIPGYAPDATVDDLSSLKSILTHSDENR